MSTKRDTILCKEMIRMAKTETLHIRLEPELKSAVEGTFQTLGLSASEAVNIFFHQVLLHDGLPFAVRKPRFNPETLAALRESDAIASGALPAKSYASAADLIREAQEEIRAEY